VLLLSASIEDQLATVRVVKRRLLYATGVALLIAAVLGSAAAAVHAQRIRRLERAANRIAEGKFDQPVVDHGEDELGELAAAFERMRVQLAQLDTARKEFVANASHELRTPLFSLAGFLELMADEDLDEETRAGFLATTREQVDRLTKLAADLLDLSRMDAGRLRVEQEEVVLADVARAVVEELSALAETTGHRLTIDAADDAWALADEERVLQIGRALAANALMHTPSGTEVRISSSVENGRAALTVSDDGPGIAREHVERIFDRFYRVEGPQASGSGLGLAIAREIARIMGGEVRLDSVAKPTMFTLDLPGEPVPPDAPRTAIAFSRENAPPTPESIPQGS
jgi:signal transduction histidine kinase